MSSSLGGSRLFFMPSVSATMFLAMHLRHILPFVFHPAERQRSIVRHLRIWIAQFPGVRRARPGVEIAQHGIVLLALFGLHDGAVLVEDIAEGDRVHRAGLFAGRL